MSTQSRNLIEIIFLLAIGIGIGYCTNYVITRTTLPYDCAKYTLDKGSAVKEYWDKLKEK